MKSGRLTGNRSYVLRREPVLDRDDPPRADRRDDELRERLREDERRDEAEPLGGGGTFAPFSRASDSPMAIACSGLFTRPPRPPFPLLSVPRFRRRIALSTDLDAASP